MIFDSVVMGGNLGGVGGHSPPYACSVCMYFMQKC